MSRSVPQKNYIDSEFLDKKLLHKNYIEDLNLQVRSYFPLHKKLENSTKHLFLDPGCPTTQDCEGRETRKLTVVNKCGFLPTGNF